MNSEKKVIPRIMLAAARSGSGKTLLTCGILQVLKERGTEAGLLQMRPGLHRPHVSQQGHRRQKQKSGYLFRR